MKRWIAILSLAGVCGWAGADEQGNGAQSGSPATPDAPAAALETTQPHRLMWEVKIGVQPPKAKALVVLLPDGSGKQSALIVKAAQGEVLLDKPYAAADVGGEGSIAVGEMSADEVRRRFGSTLAAQPLRPVSWRLFFAAGPNQLAAASKPVLAHLQTELKAELARRATAEILVVGHTDGIGKAAANDALSLKRARFVAAALTAQGIDRRLIEVSGRGTREPLVSGVRLEPKNRRVDIVVR